MLNYWIYGVKKLISEIKNKYSWILKILYKGIGVRKKFCYLIGNY